MSITILFRSSILLYLNRLYLDTCNLNFIHMRFVLKLLIFIFLTQSYDSLTQNLGEATIYNSENSNLIYNEINCLKFDSFGNLWIGTPNGLSVFTESSNSWENFYGQDSSSNKLMSNNIQSIETGEPGVFIGTNNGITHVSGYDGNLELAIWTQNYGASCLVDYNIRSMLWAPSLWIGSTGGLCIEGAGPEGEEE